MISDADIAAYERLLDAVPAPWQPLSVAGLDGFLCGVLLQPQPVAQSQWLRYVTDDAGTPGLDPVLAKPLREFASLRHAELRDAIARRDWFDPWLFGGDESSPRHDSARSVSEAVLPWVSGFALAADSFEGLMQLPAKDLVEPLAMLYLHFAADDLEDADELLAEIETLEAPLTLADAAQDIVTAVLRLADSARPVLT